MSLRENEIILLDFLWTFWSRKNIKIWSNSPRIDEFFSLINLGWKLKACEFQERVFKLEDNFEFFFSNLGKESIIESDTFNQKTHFCERNGKLKILNCPEKDSEKSNKMFYAICFLLKNKQNRWMHKKLFWQSIKFWITSVKYPFFGKKFKHEYWSKSSEFQIHSLQKIFFPWLNKLF